MCGIAGFWDKTGQFDDCSLQTMTKAIAHRGHDADGHFFENGIGLGHRRLSIIDLSENANQPMYSTCQRYVMVFNGEVYNFSELKEKIKAVNPSYSFKTKSDTEVVLAAFVTFGTGFVRMLNGMFSIAIYDKKDEKLYLYRDRVGIKPLYYYCQDGRLVFASEIKALTCLPFFKNRLTVDPTAVNDFFHLGYIAENRSIYQQIQKFPQGTYGFFDGTTLSVEHYWNLDTLIKEPLSDETNAKKELITLLETSVSGCMISDVPFGTFLSGGIDSSLVTAVAQSLSSVPINTFSIGFDDEKNEAHYAKAVANHLGTHHHELYVKEQDAMDLIPDLLQVYDEPYADSSAIPTMIVSKMAAKDITMVLSGDGGDELFLGYGAYTWAKRLDCPLVKIGRKPLAKFLTMRTNREKRVAQLLNYDDYGQIKSHIFSQEQCLFSQAEIAQLLLDDGMKTSHLQENFTTVVSLSPAQKQALFDFHYYLPDDLLVKVDRASMHYALEVRVPLLDHRVVEFAFNLEENLRKKGQTSKYLLKEVLYDYVPKPFFDRPKWGFSIPLQKWLQKDLHYLIDDYLNASALENVGLFNIGVVRKLIERFDKGETHLYNRLWLLIVFMHFMQKK